MDRYFVLDVAGYQLQAVSASWWKTMYLNGVRAGIVKLTEGTYYRNPYASRQISALKQTNLPASGYHFSRFVGNSSLAVSEANFAIANAQAMGLPAGRPIVLDYEERKGYRSSNTQACIAFLNQIKKAGYVPVFYSYSGMKNFWDFEAIHRATGATMWIAAYPHTGASYNADFNSFPGISNYITAWQFTDNFKGFGVDGSVDLTGVFTTGQKVTSGGNLDGVTFDGDKFTVSGWFASDQTQGKNYTYVIITDDKITTEYGRVKVDLTDRADVAKAYPDIPNGGHSGFKATFDYNEKLKGKKIAVIFRYTDDPDGNGNATDYSHAYDLTKSAASLDAISTSMGQKLQVSGWFASDLSLGLTNRFLLLYDVKNKKELQRMAVKSVERADVMKAYPDVYGTGQAGFAGEFDYSADLVGRQLQVIARYSDDKGGEGHYVDYWFDPFNGPSMPVLDGKTNNTFVAHDVNVATQKDGSLLVTVK